MKAFFLGWEERGNASHYKVIPMVWNGSDWIKSESEPEHRAKAQLEELEVAQQNLHAMRVRFPELDIQLVPIAEIRDIGRAPAMPHWGRRRRR